MIRIILVAICFSISSIFELYSQSGIKAVFTDTPPVIDGVVNDEVWSKAEVINELFQREPDNGAPATEKSEFYFLYDQNNLYVGVRCYDDVEGITAKEMARDVSLGDDDRIQIMLDTYLDHRSAYWFQIGPRGSIGDALVNENGKDFNKSWDGLWDGKARITKIGWEAELSIPFKTLGFNKDNSTWGLKLIRYIKRKSETITWPATTMNGNRFQLSDEGLISGISNISQGIGLDITPYVTSGISKKLNVGPKPVISGGGDAFYHITPALKAAITINTDFAQTEVDATQINLTRFDLYFPEKRDFFLDGANYYTFGINGDRDDPMNTQLVPFFSRRIGLDANGDPVAIKYGGKFTGKIGKWNIGFLHIKDDNQLKNPGYTVGRIARNIGKQSSIGIIATDGNAFSDAGNFLAGADLRLSSSDLPGNKSINYNLYGLKSITQGLTGNDISFGTELSYPNDLLNFRVGYMQIGEDFTPGLGFVPRKNIRNFYSGIGIGPRPQNSSIMQIKSGIRTNLISNLKDGGMETTQIDFNIAELIFLSGDDISFTSSYHKEKLDEDFNIFEDFVIPVDTYNFWRHSVTLTSAKRRDFWASTRLEVGNFYSGKRTEDLLQVGYKVAVPLYIGLESDRNWVDLPEGNFITQIYRINLNFLFSPNLSWYNFAQYENETKAMGWQSRFQWIIKPGRMVFITFNSPFIDPLERFKPEAYDGRVKVKYTIRF